MCSTMKDVHSIMFNLRRQNIKLHVSRATGFATFPPAPHPEQTGTHLCPQAHRMESWMEQSAVCTAHSPLGGKVMGEVSLFP